MCSPPDGVPNAVSRIRIPLTHSVPSPGCCFPNCSPIMRYALMTGYSEWGERAKVLSAVSHTAKEAGHSLTSCHVLPWVSLGTKLCCLGGWVTGKDKLFLTLSNDSNLRFFSSNNELNLLHWTTVLQNNLLTMGNYISQCSPGALRL